jgi:hypothetical protein
MNGARSSGIRCLWILRGTGDSHLGYAGRIETQTKGKVESGVKYLRRNLLCGLQGRELHSFTDMNAQLREWVACVTNQRVHGRTRDQVAVRWDVEQFGLQSLSGRLSYPYVGDWGSIFGDSIIARAILDRLLHPSTMINIRGESYRVKERRRAGPVPARERERASSNSLASEPVASKTR